MSTLDDYIWYQQKLGANGGPYAQWSGEWPPSPGPPFYMDSGDYSYAYIQKWGSNCSGQMNIPLWWVGLEAVGGTLAWEEFLRAGGWFETFVPDKQYPKGTFLVQSYGGGLGAEGHIAVVSHHDQWIVQADTYRGINEAVTVMHQHYYTPWDYAGFHPQMLPPEAGGGGKADEDGYPGDLADPDVVARWMARVAYEEYGLPPVLPVMCSYVELTGAWTGPGDVKSVPGYLNNLDWDSYGYFQQRPSMGWGSWEQVTNADYALRKFCQVAYDESGGSWNKNQTNPHILGEWCQYVQRSGHPNAYRDKGYPAAMKLIHGWSEGREEPVTPVEPVTPPEDEEYPYGWIGKDAEEYLKAVDVPDGSWFEPVKYTDGKIYLVMHTDPAWRKAREKKVDVVEFREKGDRVTVRYPDTGGEKELSRREFEELYEPMEEN